MGDQASQLRHLVLRAARQREAEVTLSPFTVAVAGGARGVGTTSVAVELSAALVELGLRVVLVDMDPHHAQLAEACGLELPPAYEPAVARRDIHEALQRGPHGIQIVPGVWDSFPATACFELALPLLAKQFQQLGRHADTLVLDCGQAPVEMLREVGISTDISIFVTSPLANFVTRTYTLLKGCVSGGVSAAAHLLINQTHNALEAEGVIHRFERSCRRFLGMGLLSSNYWLSEATVVERREQLAELASYCAASIAENRKPKRVLVAK